jgi:hypothetical protein
MKTGRIKSYSDYESMDMNPEVSSFLNEVRDLVIKEKIEITSTDENVKNVLESLLSKFMSDGLWKRSLIRNLIKYGDLFLYLHIDKDKGVYDMSEFPSEEINREEGYEGRIDNVRFRWETTGDYFEDWQVIHFRLIEDIEKLPYGESVLEKSRKKWKVLQYAEEIGSKNDGDRLFEEFANSLDVNFVDLNSIRESIVSELERMSKIHLYFLGYDLGNSDFSIKFTENK